MGTLISERSGRLEGIQSAALRVQFFPSALDAWRASPGQMGWASCAIINLDLHVYVAVLSCI